MPRSSTDAAGVGGMPAALLPAIVALGLCCLITACKPTDGKRYRVSGLVTHAGKPVPLGRILFEPDTSQGNSGPQGFAAIDNGRYDTAADFSRGAVGGPTLVRIEGSELTKDALDATLAGRQLFPTYETRIDLPREDSDQNFDVPMNTRR